MISKILFSNILSWLPLLVDRGWLLWFWPSCGGIQMTVSSWILNIQLVSLILSGLGLAGQGVLARPVCQSGSPLFIFFLFSWLRKVQKLFFLWLLVLHNQPMCLMHPVWYILEPSKFLVAQWHGMLGVCLVLSFHTEIIKFWRNFCSWQILGFEEVCYFICSQYLHSFKKQCFPVYSTV